MGAAPWTTSGCHQLLCQLKAAMHLWPTGLIALASSDTLTVVPGQARGVALQGNTQQSRCISMVQVAQSL